MNPYRTANPFKQGREINESWGDTRCPETAGTRACATTFPVKAKISDFQRFFGSEVLDGISINRKNPQKPMAFIQFKRPSDHTNALLKNQEIFLGSKITIRPYTKDTNRPKKGQSRALIHSNSPTRSRSRSRSRERGSRYANAETRTRSRVCEGDRTYYPSRSENSDRNRFSSRDERRDYSCDRTPKWPSQVTDEWGRIEPNRQPFNRDDDPNLKREVVSRPSNVQPQATTHLPPNSHSFGALSQVPALTSTGVQNGSSTLALVSSSQSNQLVTYTPDYTVQPAQPLEKLSHITQASILPRPIELLLNLVTELKTARTLSECQIQGILDYFTTVKEAVAAKDTNSDSANNQETSSHPPPGTPLNGTPVHLSNGSSAASSQQGQNSSDSRMRNSDNESSNNTEFNQVINQILCISKQEK